MCGQLGIAAERKKEITLILPAYRPCTVAGAGAGAGAVKFRGRVRTQEAHERPAEHHYYMYEYHTAAAVVVPFILRYNDSSGVYNNVYVEYYSFMCTQNRTYVSDVLYFCLFHT